MATVEERNGSFRVVFRFQGKQRKFLLGSVPKNEAESTAAKVDYLLMRLKQGLIQLPEAADIVDFVRNDGHLSPAVPVVTVEPKQQLTLRKLRDRYVAVHEGSLEGTTLQGMKIHFTQLTRTLGEGRPVQQLSLADLQEYVKTRTKAPGIRGRKLSAATIRKEIVTLKTAWNWAARMGLVTGKLPTEGLRYPKISEKPPFQTRTEIQQQIEKGHLTPGEERELWDALYLTLPEIEKLLKHVAVAAAHSWIYPLFCAAAHTGGGAAPPSENGATPHD